MNDDAEIRESLVRAHSAWLQSVIDSTGSTANAIATKAGISASNLHKLLRQDADAHPLTDPVKTKISRAMAVPMPGGHVPAPAKGFQEPEVSRYQGEAIHPQQRELANGRDVWTIQTLMMDMAGYLPGDHVITDLNATPRKGDAVFAQVYNERGAAETIFRSYLPPFLIAHTTRREAAPEPLLVDNVRVKIMCVVLSSWRDRAARQA